MAKTPAPVTALTLDICDKQVPIRRTEKKNGSGHYFTVRPANGKATAFGVPIPALADALPVSVVVEGEVILLAEVLQSTFTNRSTGLKETKHYPAGHKRAGEAMVTVEGEQRKARVVVSQTKEDGVWNLTASVTKPGGGTGGATRTALSLDAL